MPIVILVAIKLEVANCDFKFISSYAAMVYELDIANCDIKRNSLIAAEKRFATSPTVRFFNELHIRISFC